MENKESKLKWHTGQRKVNDLIPFEGNPRQMTEKQKEELQRSLEKFNLVEIPAIDTDNKICAGHQRMRIMQLLGRGEEMIDVRVPNRKMTDEEFREYNLRSNKNTGEWDKDLLANFDEELLKDTGWEGDELDEIFGLETDDEFDIEKEFKKAVENPKGVKKGDLWQLGKHKLLVGDSTDKKNWERLLGNEKFDFMFTDPPYRIGYGVGNRKQKTKKGFKLQRMRTYPALGMTHKDGKPLDISKSKLKPMFGYKGNRSYGGTQTREGGVPEFDEWLSIAKEYQNPAGANVMIFENWKNVHDLWEAIEKYWKIKNMVIWHLPNRHQGFSAKYKFFSKYDIAPVAGEGIKNNEPEEEIEDYLQEKGQKLLDSYEVILYANQGKAHWDRKKGSKWGSVADHITHSADTEKQKGDSVIFGTKPIPILIPYLKVLSPRNGIIMEPFGGSGSTIIASEIMKRQCRAIEIFPMYAEVIIKRWEKFSGGVAKKINR